MKKLPLTNVSFRYLERSFREWLDVQGFAESTVYYVPNYIRELLHYLEAEGIQSINGLTPLLIEAYYKRLQQRSNQKLGGGLSNAYLNKHRDGLRLFTNYLRKVGRLQISTPLLPSQETEQVVNYLSIEQIQLLFNATYLTPEIKPNATDTVIEAMQARDRAMLAVFYGCGLRKSEGAALNVSDINFDRSVLHVRKGKNYRERFVPISKTSLQYLTEYVYNHRDELLKGQNNDALFITYATAKRLIAQSLFVRVKKLQQRTVELQGQKVGLHTLRHSIATHLLQSGMKLESISKFLGHSSLESTQLYTHLMVD